MVDFVAGFLAAWGLRSLLDRGLRQVGCSGSNPPPPGRKPATPAGPPAKPKPHGGQLFVNDKPQFPPPRKIIEDFWPRSSN